MLMLYDRDEKLIASLKYNIIQRKRELNGLNTLEFETEREVEYGQRILFKDRNGLWKKNMIGILCDQKAKTETKNHNCKINKKNSGPIGKKISCP